MRKTSASGVSLAETDTKIGMPGAVPSTFTLYFDDLPIFLKELEGLVDKKWVILSTGESIGQKRIEHFENVKVNKLRLKVIEADREIRIKSMSAYYVTNN